PEWSGYMHDVLGVPMAPEQIVEEVVERLKALHREHLPLLPGAREAVTSLASHWPLGLASSANRPIVDEVLDLAGLRHLFAATVSAEEVARGKPAPDVYIEAAARLAVIPSGCVAVEDSTDGLRRVVKAALSWSKVRPASSGHSMRWTVMFSRQVCLITDRPVCPVLTSAHGQGHLRARRGHRHSAPARRGSSARAPGVGRPR